MKVSKLLVAGLVSLIASTANSTAVFVPVDDNINFIAATGDLSNATIAIFDDATDIGGSTSLVVSTPELIFWDGVDTLSGSNGSLTIIDGDFVIAAICSACTNVWTGGDIDYGSELTVPEANSYAITFSGITGFELVVDLTPVPVPAAVWLFGSGLLGLAGIARRKKAA